MKRSTPLRRRTPVKRANRARKASEFARTYHSKERVAFVKSLPCCVCFYSHDPSDNAHIKTGGTGRKADAKYIVPLCRTCHRKLHQMGQGTFARYVRNLIQDDTFDLYAEAAMCDTAWQRHSREGGE